jgi:hypothetical protein
MNTTNFDKEICERVEQSAVQVLDCNLHDIVGFCDSEAKKVVVFLLAKFYDFDKYNLGKAYQLYYGYVPTLVELYEFKLLTCEVFRNVVFEILNNCSYGSNLDIGGSGVVERAMA